MNRMSTKRAAKIKAEGTRMNGTFKVDVAAIRARQDAMSKKVADVLFGKAKSKDSARDDRRKAKARAWKQFSMFIRLRDSDAFGRVQCITCPRSDYWKTMDAGHFITRAKEATLFDERNVSGQCKGCNRFQGGKFFEHEQAIDRKFGAGTAQAIKDKAGQICKRTTSDYQFIENTCRIRIENIRKNSPGKFR